MFRRGFVCLFAGQAHGLEELNVSHGAARGLVVHGVLPRLASQLRRLVRRRLDLGNLFFFRGFIFAVVKIRLVRTRLDLLVEDSFFIPEFWPIAIITRQ